jgi:hypothetical protein
MAESFLASRTFTAAGGGTRGWANLVFFRRGRRAAWRTDRAASPASVPEDARNAVADITIADPRKAARLAVVELLVKSVEQLNAVYEAKM